MDFASGGTEKAPAFKSIDEDSKFQVELEKRQQEWEKTKSAETEGRARNYVVVSLFDSFIISIISSKNTNNISNNEPVISCHIIAHSRKKFLYSFFSL